MSGMAVITGQIENQGVKRYATEIPISENKSAWLYPRCSCGKVLFFEIALTVNGLTVEKEIIDASYSIGSRRKLSNLYDRWIRI